MNPISSATTTDPSLRSSPDAAPSRVPQKTLGQDEFLKLLARQFQFQDPMKPMEDTSFIAHMAQFTALEQANVLSGHVVALRADQQWSIATGYLGQHVTLSNGSEAPETGVVDAIDASGSAPQLIVNGQSYPLSAVVRVEPRASAPSTPPPSAGNS